MFIDFDSYISSTLQSHLFQYVHPIHLQILSPRNEIHPNICSHNDLKFAQKEFQSLQ